MNKIKQAVFLGSLLGVSAVLAGCNMPRGNTGGNSGAVRNQPNTMQVVRLGSSTNTAPVSATSPIKPKLVGGQTLEHFSVKFINFSAENVVVVLNHEERLMELLAGGSEVVQVSLSSRFLVYEVRSVKNWASESVTFDPRLRFYTVRIEGDGKVLPPVVK